MASCREIQQKNIDFLNGNLSDEDLETFLAHLHTCEECREELKLYYTVLVGFEQEDDSDGNMAQGLLKFMDSAWFGLRCKKLLHAGVCCADTLGVTGLFFILLLWFGSFLRRM